TRRTVGEVLNVAQWAFDHDIELVAFHRYNPIRNSFEEEPTAEDMQEVREKLKRWLAGRELAIEIRVDSDRINDAPVPERRSEFASDEKRRMTYWGTWGGGMFPMEIDNWEHDPLYICVAPLRYVEIGL